METLNNIVLTIQNYMSNIVLIIALAAAGIWFSIRTGFIQVRGFKRGIKQVFGGLFGKKGDAGDDGMSSFQAVATSIAAQVGTGNITGCATAMISGGPGAIFWMWVAAFFGMATIFAEATLAQKFKTTRDGEITGGPAYYIRAAFKGRFGKVLAGIFSVLVICALGFMGNMVQSNSIGAAFRNAFGIPPLVIGVFVAAAAGFVFLGGVQRIASVTEKIVPVMALFYIIGALIILAVNFRRIPDAFAQIFTGAFSPQALAGGAMGITVQKAIRFGVARGLFSNEAGMGSTPHAHAVAKVKSPCDQGIVAMMGVFIDTFIILTLTALVVLVTGVLPRGYAGELQGVDLTQAGFETVFGRGGTVFIAVCMLFFAFSTIIGWYFFGEVNIRSLFGKKGVKVYALLVCVFVAVGSTLKVDLVWSLSDTFNGLMVIPNLISLLSLSGTVSRLYRAYGKPKQIQEAS